MKITKRSLNKDIKDKIPSPDLFHTLNKEEQEAMLQLNSMRSFEKGDILIREGEYFTASFFVVDGCVRQYRIVDGQEITNEFYTEQQSIYSPPASAKDLKSKFYLECLEDCRISVVGFDKEKEIYERFPRFEKMCRIQTEADLHDFQDRFADYISSTPEERYLKILEKRPNLIERVQQYHLASYLGVKPESLSRIRKRLAKK